MDRTFAAITTFHNDGYVKYGKNMIESFDKYWPKDVTLYAYYEGVKPTDLFSDRIVFLDLLVECPDLVAFKSKYGGDPLANGDIGISPNGIKRPNTVSSKHANKKSFLFDAIRFSHKSYCQNYASLKLNVDVMLWLDADTFTFREIPKSFLEKILPENNYCSYLGRAPRYSECGFIAYDIKHPQHKEFMKRHKEFYDIGSIFSLKEWHDCEVFDAVRQQMINEGKMVCYNLTIPGKGHHPFINSMLGDYMDHMKGKRKNDGRSPKGELKVNKNLDYWKR